MQQNNKKCRALLVLCKKWNSYSTSTIHCDESYLRMHYENSAALACSGIRTRQDNIVFLPAVHIFLSCTACYKNKLGHSKYETSFPSGLGSYHKESRDATLGYIIWASGFGFWGGRRPATPFNFSPPLPIRARIAPVPPSRHSSLKLTNSPLLNERHLLLHERGACGAVALLLILCTYARHQPAAYIY